MKNIKTIISFDLPQVNLELRNLITSSYSEETEMKFYSIHPVPCPVSTFGKTAEKKANELCIIEFIAHSMLVCGRLGRPIYF